MNFEAIVGVVAVLAASATAFSALLRNVASAFTWRAERLKLQSIRVDRVVAEADLNSLGALIVRDLGGTSIPNYVRHPDVRTSFRHAFNAARGFIGEGPEPESSQVPGEATDHDESARADREDRMWEEELLTQSGQLALKDVAEGESWNSLARMRRDLEIALALRLDLPEGDRRMAVGQLLAVAAKQGVVPAESVAALRYPISVANRAIHGEEISPDVAVEAIVLIDRFIRSLMEEPSAGEAGSAR